MKNNKTRKIYLPCQCVGGHKTCGYLYIINFLDGSFEFNWIKDRRKRSETGVFLLDDGMKKLREFINYVPKNTLKKKLK